MKLLIDMNLSPEWVGFLASHDVQAVHWSDMGDPRATDQEILQYAATHQWIVFTHDLDFGTLLAQSGAESPSVVQVRSQDVLPVSIGSAVLAALRLTTPQLREGALVTVDPLAHRVRILPIRPT